MFMKYARRLLRNLCNTEQEREDRDQCAPQPTANADIQDGAFRDEDLVMVLWNNLGSLGPAPWDEKRIELTASPGFSVGLFYDLPERGGVLVRPHVADLPDTRNDGTVFVPYMSVIAICPLTIEDPLKPVSALRQSAHLVPYVGTC